MATDELPLSSIAAIDHELRERIDGELSDENLEAIAELNRRRAELSKASLFDEARGLLARIAAPA